MNKNKTNGVPAVTVNYVITKGSIIDQLKYSLFKLLDWRVGNAVCISVFDDGNIFINDCPSDLKAELVKKLGGHACDAPGFANKWGIDDGTDICTVLRVVTDWINRQ